jgi:hypothetical protein
VTPIVVLGYWFMTYSSEDIDKKIASIIRKELKSENYDDNCWLKAFSKADGDEQKAKVLYIDLRTNDLKKQKKKEKLIEDSKTHSYMRCGRSFCVDTYKIISISKALIGTQKCQGCGNVLDYKMSEKDALDAIENPKSKTTNYTTRYNEKEKSFFDKVLFFFKEILNGHKGLPITFWGYFLGGNAVFKIWIMLLISNNDSKEDISLFIILNIIWSIFAIIAVFNSAAIYKAKKIKEGLEYPWATTAKIACIVLALSSIGNSIPK